MNFNIHSQSFFSVCRLDTTLSFGWKSPPGPLSSFVSPSSSRVSRPFRDVYKGRSSQGRPYLRFTWFLNLYFLLWYVRDLLLCLKKYLDLTPSRRILSFRSSEFYFQIVNIMCFKNIFKFSLHFFEDYITLLINIECNVCFSIRGFMYFSTSL